MTALSAAPYCRQCVCTFHPKRVNQKFCSGKCKYLHNNKNRTLKPNQIYQCKGCGAHVERYISPSALASGKYTAEFCGRACAGMMRRGENHPQWKGGRITEADGYVMIYCPGHPNANNKGYVFEHRLVMEKQVGRILAPAEVVHHRDENRSNNDPSNLFLYASNADHKRDDIAFRSRDAGGRLVAKETVNGNG